MYNTNPYAPKARRLAVNDVRLDRYTVATAAAKYAVARSTIYRWIAKADPDHRVFIHTLSSRPHTHPHQLPKRTVDRCLALRQERGRCAPVLHAHLKAEGYTLSLSSVERILRRYHLTRKKKQASYDLPVPRPKALALGDLVQMDTIHYVRPDGSRFYLYTLIDLYSRIAFAWYAVTLSWQVSVKVALMAQAQLGQTIRMMQTDNGPEFRDAFASALRGQSILCRHSRVRTPNDNAHIERFN